MAPRPLRVAVVGVGRLGRIHAQIYAQLEGAELAFVVDPNEGRARALAEELGCASLGSASDLGDDIDAVSVVVPTIHHCSVAVPLLERGIPCLVEKPLAPSLEQADSILAAAERGGAALAVGHVERFQPGVRRVRELGLKPRFIECHRLSELSFRAMDVGVVHDLMIHDLDLVVDLMGSEVAQLDAAGGAILTASEDMASVHLVFENGGRANVTASRVSLSPMRRFRLFAAESYVSLDFNKNYGLLVRKGPDWDVRREELRSVDPAELVGIAEAPGDGMLEVVELELTGLERPLQAELASFVDAVRSGRAPEVGGEDGRRALELAERIVAQIRSHSW